MLLFGENIEHWQVFAYNWCQWCIGLIGKGPTAGLQAIPQDIARCLYRVTQEELRHVARHAGATQAEVVLTR